jgi:hypothetical protein
LKKIDPTLKKTRQRRCLEEDGNRRKCMFIPADLRHFRIGGHTTAEAVFRDVCAVEVDDGVQFDPESVKGSAIRKGAGYNGVRIDILGRLEKARLELQIDIGFGDAVTPGPVSVTYLVLLDDQPAAKLRAYPKCTVVAEKFEAICKLGQGNSRMKDYFDLWVLLGEGDLDNGQLRRAIEATLERRKTPLPMEMPIGLTDTFTSDPAVQRLWTAFLKKNRLDSLSLAAVVALVREGIAKTDIIGQAGNSKA